MAKYFEVDFRKGSFNDTMGRTVTVTGSPVLNKRDKGISAELLNNSNYLSYNTQILPNGAFTVVYYLKQQPGILQYVINNNGSTVAMGQAGGNPNTMVLALGASNYKYVTYNYDKKYHCFIITCPGSSQTDILSARFFADGIEQSTSIVQSTAGAQDVRTGANRIFGYGSTLPSNVMYVATYDHVFTEQERSLAYKDFLNSYPQGKDKYACGCVKPMDLSREKENTVGQDLFGSGISITGWDTDSTILSSNSFSTTNGYIRNSTPTWVAGKKYRVEYSISFIGGTGLRVYDYAFGNNYFTILASSPTGTFEFTPSVVAGTGITFLEYGGASTITFNYFRIREVTGLVAAYNFIPNGNTLVDISGNGKNGTKSGRPVSTRNGISFKSASNDAYAISSISLGTVHSASSRFRITKPGIYNMIGLSDNSSGVTGYVNSTNNQLHYQPVSGNNVNVPFTPGDKWNTVTITRNDTTVKFWANGVLIDTKTLGVNGTLTCNAVSFTGFSDLELADLRVYNRVLSDTEIKAYHNSFVSPTLTEDFSTEGADGVSKVPSGWVKQSGNFKIGEFQPTIGKLINTVFTTGWFLGTNVSQNNGTLIFANTATGQYGQHTANFTKIGSTYRIKYTASGCDAGTFVLAFGGVNHGAVTNGTRDRLLTSASVGSILFQATSNGVYGNISNLSIEEVSPLPTFRPGTKYLESTFSDSKIIVPSKQAYGVWEFDYYFAGIRQPFISFGNNSARGYSAISYSLYFNWATAGSVNFWDNNQRWETATNYLQPYTWYRFKISRTLSGVFTVYIKGGSYGTTDWTLISTVGGTGSNPYTNNSLTTAESIYLAMPSGDRIANINLLDGIKQL